MTQFIAQFWQGIICWSWGGGRDTGKDLRKSTFMYFESFYAISKNYSSFYFIHEICESFMALGSITITLELLIDAI